MNKAFFFGFLYFTMNISLFSQSTVLNCESDLILLNHYVNKGKNLEAITFANDMLASQLCKSYYDSIYFFKGQSFYQLQKFDSAQINFNKVQSTDTLKTRSLFMSSLNSAYVGDFESASIMIDKISPASKNLQKLKSFEKAGCSLLKREIITFNNISNKFTYSDYYIQNEEKELINIYNYLIKEKKKVPLKAAVFSAIIPGSGKWYCKSQGRAIATFLTVAILSAITIENGSKNGWSNYRTIIAGSATMLFYGGNIYGSYYETKRYNNKLDESVNKDIIYNMDVAIRNVYY